MLRTRALVVALLPALLLGACGGGGKKKSSSNATKPQAAQTETQTTETTAPPGSPEATRAKEITSCLQKAHLSVITNGGGQVPGAKYELVIDAGTGGVLYGFANASKAAASEGKVLKEEGSAGRKVQVIKDTVFAYFAPGQSLAAPEKYDRVRKCAA